MGHKPKAAAPAADRQVFADSLDSLDHRLGVAAEEGDADAIEELYRELDGLKPSGPAEGVQYVALARRFHHLAPRKPAD
jgi:hypothetical protein